MLSGALAVCYVIAAIFIGGAETAFKVGLFLILPIACIWFSESMGSYVGPVWPAAITHPTPAVFVCIGGWLLLLVPLIVAIVLAIA